MIDIKVSTIYPFNDKFSYITKLQKINLDEERINDLRTGKGFIITSNKGIKKEIKEQSGIFSARFGSTLRDEDAFAQKYRCECGLTKGTINHGLECPHCHTVVKYVDDRMDIFGWLVLKYNYIIHPNIYTTIGAFIGDARLNRIIEPIIEVDQDGIEIETPNIAKKKDEPFIGIGMVEFMNRFDEIMGYYLSKYPHKRKFYDDIMSHRNIVFAQSIPVFTTLLRPTKLDNIGSLKYEKTNENYKILSTLVYKINQNKLTNQIQKKSRLQLLYDIQFQFNEIYTEIVNILAKKKGDIRSSIGGRYSFSSRSVIAQDPWLYPDQVRLPYHGLCELLKLRIINILVRSYHFSYAEAYKKWYKGQLNYDPIVYQIIECLINDSDGGIPILINRNPTISLGGILSMKCVGINMDYTMSIPLTIIKGLGADFDGDTLNILLLVNQDFINAAEAILSPRQLFISKNDGRCNMDQIHSRDIIINANSMKSLYSYTEDEIMQIEYMQSLD